MPSSLSPNAQHQALICTFSQALSSSLTLIAAPRGVRHLSPVTDLLNFPPFVAVVSELHVSDLPFSCLCRGCRTSL